MLCWSLINFHNFPCINNMSLRYFSIDLQHNYPTSSKISRWFHKYCGVKYHLLTYG